MDSSKEFQFMLDKAIDGEPLAFNAEFSDRTKNVQAQLQEMVRYSCWRSSRYKAKMFADWCYSIKGIYQYSMEQLWLGYAMRERFGKEWSGEDWVVVNSKILKES